jgi:hypothetical protein
LGRRQARAFRTGSRRVDLIHGRLLSASSCIGRRASPKRDRWLL